jgi:hypothetical protein
MRVVVVATCVGILGAAGCGAKKAAKHSPAPLAGSHDTSSSWQTAPLPARAEPTAVKEGAAPLVYMVEGGATIRVRDVKSKLDLARAFVPARTIVRVDATRGVIYGDEVVYPGPLPEGGRYVVFVDPAGENVARQGTFQPRPHKAR